MGESTVKTYHTTIRALKEFRSEIRIKDISTKLLDDLINSSLSVVKKIIMEMSKVADVTELSI